MEIDLEQLKSLAQKATRGPWTVDAQDFVADANGNDIAETLYGNYENNAAYIAAVSPDMLMKLLDRIEQLEKETAMLAGFCKCGDDYPCPPQAWGYSRFCEKEDWDSDCGHCWRAAVQIRLEKK